MKIVAFGILSRPMYAHVLTLACSPTVALYNNSIASMLGSPSACAVEPEGDGKSDKGNE